MLAKIKILTEKKLFIPAILVVIAIASHFQWFNPFSILTYGDWGYWNLDASRELITSWGTWLSNSNTGSPNIQISFYIFNVIWGLLGHIGIGYEIAPKITLLIPTAILSFLSPYFYGLFMTRNKYMSFVGALFYGSCTYFLVRQTGQIPIAFVFALCPLTLYVFENAIIKSNIINWTLFSLIFWLSSCYEIRISLIVLTIIIIRLLCVYSNLIVKNLKYLPYIISIYVGLSMFWLLPTLLGGAVSAISATAGRGLFGDNLFNLQHALALSDSAWTGSIPNNTFVLQNIKLYLWLLPAALILGVIYFKSKKLDVRKSLYCFVLIALTGIVLTKQSTAPIPTLYNYLYLNLPGFDLYREASKFYLYTTLGFLGILLIVLKNLSVRKKWYLLSALCGLVVITFSINIFPLVTGDIGTLFVQSKEPNAYIATDKQIKQSTDYYRTAWLPTTSRWAYFSNTHPKISLIDFIQSSGASFLPDLNGLSTSDQAKGFLSSSISDQVMKLLDIKYLIIPAQYNGGNDDIYQYYGFNKDLYTNLINKASSFTKVMKNFNGATVYLNNYHSSYFTAGTRINLVSNSGQYGQFYKFKSSVLGDNDLNFATQKKNDKYQNYQGVNSIIDLSQNLNKTNLQNGQFIYNGDVKADVNTELYANTNLHSYSFTINNSKFNSQSSNENDLHINNLDVGSNLTNDDSSTIQLDKNKNYSLAIADKLVDINQDANVTRNIGTTAEPINLYSSVKESNGIVNGSFENGPWQSNVKNCNRNINDNKITMDVTNKLSSVGKSSLMLAAQTGTACLASNEVAVSPLAIMSLSYDYQIKKGQRAGYDLVFNDNKHTVISSDQVNTTDRWFNLNVKFAVPNGATGVQLIIKGYPNDNGQEIARTYYDNVMMRPLTLTAVISPGNQTTYTKTALQSPQVKAKIVNPNYTYENLIKNPSLENGFWQKKVNDCNAVDDNPLIAQSLNKQSKTDGKQSLELDATRHIACTGPASVAVKEGQSYLLSFDYKSPTESQAGYYVSFDDPSGTFISEQLPITDHNWHTFTKTFVVPFGATHISLNVYSYADQYGGIKEVNLYDNFYLTQIPTIQNRYYVVSTPKVTLKQPQHISYQLSSPTKKYVQVTGASTPFYLNMSESYHPQWRLELEDVKSNGGLASWSPKAHPTAVPDVDHFDYDNFLNSWYVDPAKLCASGSTACHKNADGSYNLKLIAEFAPQRYFYAGLLVSGATLLGCFGYLGYYYYQRRAYTRGVKRSAEHARKK